MDSQSMFRLNGRVALITGGGGALGSRMALILAGAGATVVLAGRTLGTLQAAAAAVQEKGGKAICVQMDVMDEQSIMGALDHAREQAGVVDVLINNAGANRAKAALAITAADWDAVLGTNLRGCFLLAREFAKRLIEAKRPGAIVNIGSVLALRGQKGVSPYMSAKAGLVHLTHSLALEWARYGIRVNALLPGYISTDLTEKFLASEEGQRIVRNIPQRRLATAAELAGPLLLLASDASSYMTGSSLVADGGLVVTSL